MKNGHFVENLSNVQRFTSGWRTVQARAANEASWLLTIGHPGFGKTRTLEWFAMQLKRKQQAVAFVRAKANWTPRRMLMAIAESLDILETQPVERLEKAIMAELSAKDGLLIIDELNLIMRDLKTLETLRDITDSIFCPLIAGAHADVPSYLKARYPQIHSRIGQVVEFGPATAGDVHEICNALAEVQIADDLAGHILNITNGSFRLVRGAIGRVEAFGRTSRGAITLQQWGDKPLLASAPNLSIASERKAARA